jgi:hypothetical protein
MSETKTVLLKVELDVASLKKNSEEASKKLEELKIKQAILKNENKQGTVEYAKLANEIRATSKQLKDNASAIEINNRLNLKNTGSIVEMREALKSGIIAYNNLSKEQRENSEEGKKLQEQNLALKKSINEQEEAVGNFTGSVGNYAKGILGLKQELKELKGQMAGLDAGSEEYQKASIRAGELGDKIKEVNENVKASTGGTGFEKMSNNIGLIKGDLENLDFAGVSEKMKQMATISKTMTFGEAVGGLKSMGSALLNLGKAILANPLFLMVGAIVAIVGALKMWSDSVEQEAIRSQDAHTKSLENNIKAMERQADISKRLNDARLRDAELNNASERELSKIRLKALDDEYEDIKKQALAKYNLEQTLRKQFKMTDDADRQKDLNDKIKTAQEERIALSTEYKYYTIEREALVKENNARILQEEKDGAEKRKSQQEKELQDRLAIERRINDLILEGKQLSYEQEKQQLDAKYEFLTNTSKDNAQELLNIEEMKLVELQQLNDKHRQIEIDSTNEEYKRQIEDADGNAKEIALLKENQAKELKIIDDRYRIDSKKAEIEFGNFKIETEKNIEKERLDIKQKTAMLEAEINLEKVKGTEQEFSAWSELQFTKFRILEENYKKDLEQYKDNEEKKKEIDLQFQKDSLDIQTETFSQQSKNSEAQTEKTKEQKKSEILSIVNSAQQLTDALFQIQQNQIQAELNKDQDKYNEKQTLLQQQLDAGIISQAEFNAQKSKLDSDYAKQEAKLKKEAFEKNKQSQIINATIATAVGVANALATAPPASFVLAGLAGALGALQIATIVSQPTPKFEKGGMFGGKPHSAGGTKGYFDDGTQIEVEKDEAFFILNKRSSAMINQLSNLNQLGGGVSFFQNGGGVKFAQGGAVGTGISTSIENRIEMQNQMIRAFQLMPNPVVAVQDINDGVRNYVNLVNRAEF